jgi:hypothetical protein
LLHLVVGAIGLGVLIYGAFVLPYSVEEARRLGVSVHPVSSIVYAVSTGAGYYLMPVFYLAVAIGLFYRSTSCAALQWAYGIAAVVLCVVISLIVQVAFYAILLVVPVLTHLLASRYGPRAGDPSGAAP